MIKKVENTVRWTYIIEDLNGEESFMRKNRKRQTKQSLELKKIIKKKSDKLNVK